MTIIEIATFASLVLAALVLEFVLWDDDPPNAA